MDTLLKADIFFVVATVALVVIAIVLCVALLYLIRILRTAAFLSERIKEQALHIEETLARQPIIRLFMKSPRKKSTGTKKKEETK
ncbi:MAG: hypothetical protein AAB460_00635 [Patescibacteria group bacterium]